MNMNFSAPKILTPNEMIGEYVALRNGKKAAEEQFAEWLRANYTARMDELEMLLLDFINKHGGKNFAGDAGTAFKTVQTSVTVADQLAFREHVIATQAFELIDWRANKTAVKEVIKQVGVLPPGLNYSERETVNIRKPTA